MGRKTKLALFEVACVIWMAGAGSLLHFAFELSEFWTPMAFLAAVNESAWEHVKMYFWPGLFFAFAQYTYTRDIANNYWFGKAMGLLIMPVVIFSSYFGYMAYIEGSGVKPSLSIMIGIMFLGIIAGQLASYIILTREPLQLNTAPITASVMVGLIAVFSTFTYFAPQAALFEHYYCYTHTGEYGILDDYEPYLVFRPAELAADGTTVKVNYCAGFEPS